MHLESHAQAEAETETGLTISNAIFFLLHLVRKEQGRKNYFEEIRK